MKSARLAQFWKIWQRVMIVAIWLVLFAGAQRAVSSVLVITNRAQLTASFRIESLENGPPHARNYRLEPGDCLPIPVTGATRIEFKAGPEARQYRVQPKSLYYFHQNDKMELELGQIGLSLPEVSQDGEKPSPILAAFPAEQPKFDLPVVIPVKILSDDFETTVPAALEARLRRRVEQASQLFRRQCFVEFQVVEFVRWTPPPQETDLKNLLIDFERQVKPSPARLAIGFHGRDLEIPPDKQLGGTRGPLHSHLLIREWAIQNTEHERLQLLIHELGHFLGAAHSPEADSVMRPVLSDRKARSAQFHLVFDPLNTLAMCLVSNELRLQPRVRFHGIEPSTKRDLARIYSEITKSLPDDSAALVNLRSLSQPPKSVEH